VSLKDQELKVSETQLYEDPKGEYLAKTCKYISEKIKIKEEVKTEKVIAFRCKIY